MVTKVSEKHSTSIFWAETKFNNVESLLPHTQEQQNSPTSLNSTKTGSNLSLHHCKTLNAARPTCSCQKTF